jgi:two-component system, chemotaxis family, protein-glutamate methylesterase/glutaminase
MDIQMPIMDGLEATRQIMSIEPTPIVVISSTVSDESLSATYSILEAGALVALAKPSNVLSADFESSRQHIVRTLRNMAEIKVARKRIKKPGEHGISGYLKELFPD